MRGSGDTASATTRALGDAGGVPERTLGRRFGDGVDGKKPFYTPKLRVTFYLYRDARQPFLETIAPIIFALFANALNVVFSKQFEEFLANGATVHQALQQRVQVARVAQVGQAREWRVVYESHAWAWQRL